MDQVSHWTDQRVEGADIHGRSERARAEAYLKGQKASELPRLRRGVMLLRRVSRIVSFDLIRCPRDRLVYGEAIRQHHAQERGRGQLPGGDRGRVLLHRALERHHRRATMPCVKRMCSASDLRSRKVRIAARNPHKVLSMSRRKSGQRKIDHLQ